MDGKTAVVTGASRGVGQAVAREFAAAGAMVVCCARDGEVIEKFGDEIDGIGLRADVRDEYDVERLMETAVRKGGSIDVLVPNAAVYHGTPGETPLDGESYAAFDNTVRTNVRGVFTTITEAIPHLHEEARILIPTGTIAREPKPGLGTYAVSKAGAEALMRGFATDLDRAVACLDPGQVATDLSGPAGRDPEEIAPMFRWAASLAPEELNGEIIDLRAWKKTTR
jgi:3-oxoacyl-[acyl-carrier protein] reductase